MLVKMKRLTLHCLIGRLLEVTYERVKGSQNILSLEKCLQ